MPCIETAGGRVDSSRFRGLGFRGLGCRDLGLWVQGVGVLGLGFYRSPPRPAKAP